MSQYRNLLHHYVHQRGQIEASTFWGACGAIRRSVFEEVGGFDEERYPRCIEDIELGYRLRRAGHRIVLDKNLQGTHLKKWTLWSVIRTDVCCRAMPWTRLILETRSAPDDLNLRDGQRVSVGLVGLACLALLLAPFYGRPCGCRCGAAGGHGCQPFPVRSSSATGASCSPPRLSGCIFCRSSTGADLPLCLVRLPALGRAANADHVAECQAAQGVPVQGNSVATVKILLISPWFPVPAFGGALIRVLETLRYCHAIIG